MSSASDQGFLGRVFGRTEGEVDAAELRDHAAGLGCISIADAPLAEPVTITGRVRQVVLRPRAGVPALSAEVYDGSQGLNLVWLGRRRIRGITPGRTLVAEGRITRQNGQLTMFNPKYQLRPAGE
jgi:RecG-like helicase